jgi:hypothetical protein
MKKIEDFECEKLRLKYYFFFGGNALANWASCAGCLGTP